jgi:hypothetical protein
MTILRNAQKAEDRAEETPMMILNRFPYPLLKEATVEQYRESTDGYVKQKAFYDLLDSFQNLLAEYEALEDQLALLEEEKNEMEAEKDIEIDLSNGLLLEMRSAIESAMKSLNDAL